MTLRSETRSRTRQRLILILVAALFIGPFVTAWVLFYHPELWQARATINHGTLIVPARPIPPLPLQRQDGNPLPKDFLRGRWTLLMFSAADCGEVCIENLYKVRQIHVALQKHQGRVQRLFVPGVLPSTAITQELERVDPDLIVALAARSKLDEILAQFRESPEIPLDGTIQVIDPLGNFMMRYPPDANPKDILSDLRRLLKVSQVG